MYLIICLKAVNKEKGIACAMNGIISMITETYIWLSVDPMSDERSWLSPYNYCQLNPLGRVDPSGALDDWFENELTGDVYYNSEYRKGDEGTGCMQGEDRKSVV